MSIANAQISFQVAANYLRRPEDRALLNINTGLLHLCDAIKKIELQIEEVERKVLHVSQQVGPR